jgi:hypothetical protein
MLVRRARAPMDSGSGNGCPTAAVSLTTSHLWSAGPGPLSEWERTSRVSGRRSKLVSSAARPRHEREPRKRNRTSAALARAVAPRLKLLQSVQDFIQHGLPVRVEGNVPATNYVELTLESQLESCKLLIAQVRCLPSSSSRLTLLYTERPRGWIAGREGLQPRLLYWVGKIGDRSRFAGRHTRRHARSVPLPPHVEPAQRPNRACQGAVLTRGSMAVEV